MRYLRNFTIASVLLIALIFGGAAVLGQSDTPEAPEPERPTDPRTGSPLHPDFPLVDADGVNVLESGAPVSTMQTCGSCHDTEFIASHSGHADAGLSALTGDGDSEGYFGGWNPLTYRMLSELDATIIDMTTPEWVQNFHRHVGGGPAMYARNGTRLDELEMDSLTVENAVVNPETGELAAWDWSESGVVEMNCFLCHTDTPDNDARISALENGDFGWANTATLQDAGVVEATDDGWRWRTDAFDESGNLKQSVVPVQDPVSSNCSACHSQVHTDSETPMVLDPCTENHFDTLTTGAIFSPQQLSNSGINLDDKNDLDHAFDVHAARVMACTDCHYSENNPIYFTEDDGDRPEHLTFDPRRLDFGEYLYRPAHQFTVGERDCASCHDTAEAHEWLPYLERHMNELSCESCHVPEIQTTAMQHIDWTVLDSDGEPTSQCRGIAPSADGTPAHPTGTTLIEGFQPVLLPDEEGKLAPHNAITSWYWAFGEDEQPVPARHLQAVYFEDGAYALAVVEAFDADDSGDLTPDELQIDTEEQESLIAERLAEQGLENPRIVGQVDTYAIHHNVVGSDWATRECTACHSDDSRLNVPMQLTGGNTPGGQIPSFSAGSGPAADGGNLTVGADGALYLQPVNPAGDSQHYVFGRDYVDWVDTAGVLIFLATLAGVSGHAGLRYLTARRRVPQEPELRRVYMYSVYERQWHWLQTAVILGLIFTGLVIHKPDTFSMFQFRLMVDIHNVLALILVINAFLALFYHLASGEIQQYLPRPRGFFSQAIEQTRFYISGIFRGEEHPFEKTRNRKLNPLQQLTYFGILNVLLPVQVITGALMWGMQRWPELGSAFGGLPVLAPIHTLASWLFATFIVAHVYLTTTGHQPLAGIQAMIGGWDDVEVHHDDDGAASTPTAKQEG